MKTCNDCIHSDVCGGYIMVVHFSKDSNTDVEKVCNYFKDESKYVEVHAPHGRLIDADRLYDVVEQSYRMSSGAKHSCERDLLNLICDLPTIVESS